MKKIFMIKNGGLICPVYITRKKIKEDTRRLAFLGFSEIILESTEDNEPADDELIFSWARSYSAIAKN